MDLSGNRFVLAITIEILTLFMYISCILINVFCGSKFTKRDIIFTAFVFSTSFTIFGITVFFACKSRTAYTLQTTNRKLYSRLHPGQRLHASDCAICLSPKEPASSSLARLSCNHDYHTKCIKECFEKTGDIRCPKCRQTSKDVSSLKSSRFRCLASLPKLQKFLNKKETFSYKESFV
ncbi:uncharacterized protein LOC125683465 [Ostrea edulis]|uniref:uncharacterized protein LOC125683465 n=1 Tax=Ostrea edulis TaxID=37623 RepID=UPI002095CA31|nr:uncharacterized protein LOC125683465 [Ostrea edulis]